MWTISDRASKVWHMMTEKIINILTQKCLWPKSMKGDRYLWTFLNFRGPGLPDIIKLIFETQRGEDSHTSSSYTCASHTYQSPKEIFMSQRF